MTSPGGNHRVLIVDDKKAIGETTVSIFTKSDYEARVAQSAEEAGEVLAEWQPDLAIPGCGLPKMSGIDLAIAPKNSHPACCADDLLARAQADGHLFEVLAKPVHPTVILDRAAHFLSPISPEATKTPEELDWALC
jgi:DNA-binding response OmpR family regulator